MALNPKKSVGLDIGSSVVKAVQLRKVGRNFELEKFGVAEIYPGVDKKSASVDRRDAKVEAIRQALNSAGISAKFSVSAVSGESIIVRYIQLPEMPENELKGAIRWEAEDYIPFPLEEVNLDSMILGRSEVGGAPKIDVLLVAAKKELVAEHIDLLKGADLTPAVIDVDSFAFLNCFEANYLPTASEVVALLNIGSEITSINIYIGGVSRFSRDIAVAGDTITSGIQQRLNCTFQRAEELKLKEGAPAGHTDELDSDLIGGSSLLDTIRGTVEKITGEDLAEDSPEFIAANVIKSTLGNLTNEIRRSIQFFENQPNGKPVQRVAIGGGTANLRNLDQYFARELGLPAEIIDPLRNVGYGAGVADRDRLERVRQMLGVSLGLALRVFDQ
ncbi:MAG: type IV pilus assembly protein PilM [Candidatus Sumerlaeaceae bacterium]